MEDWVKIAPGGTESPLTKISFSRSSVEKKPDISARRNNNYPVAGSSNKTVAKWNYRGTTYA